MENKTIERLVNILAAQQVMLTALISCVQQLGLKPEAIQRTLQTSARFGESYRNQLKELLMDFHLSDEQEQQMWTNLGLGDLWKPSQKPDDKP